MSFVIFCKNNSFFLSVKVVLKPLFCLIVNLLQTTNIEQDSNYPRMNDIMYMTSKKKGNNKEIFTACNLLSRDEIDLHQNIAHVFIRKRNGWKMS